ncbi:reverse transcriptase domain-containing protein [Tanacetum coccineum]|uniref:Reverse transcriptase domain-containing protein n=1 Tax=Tanacetum coccineum TaxID=301880 RepID=A0ABQ5GZD8_9ASTR
MHTRASNSELVEPLPEPERTLNRRLRRRNRRVPFEQRNNPPQHPKIVYQPILDINYFCHFLDILRNYDPMDDEPMWAADRVVALTPGSAVTIPEAANEFAIKADSSLQLFFFDSSEKSEPFFQHEKESITDAWLRMKEMLRNCHGHNLSKGNIIKIIYHGFNEITQKVLNAAAGGIFLYKTPNQAYQLLEDKVLLKLDWAKNQKTKSSLKKTISFAAEGSSNFDTKKIMARMDAMTMKMDAQYKEFQSRSKKSNLDDDDIPMSCEEEAKFMQTFCRTHFYNDYCDCDSNRDNWRSSGRNDYNRDNYQPHSNDKPDLQIQLSDFIKAQHSTNSFDPDLENLANNHQASIQNLEAKFDRLADKKSGRPSGSLPSNTQPTPKGSSSKPYQPPQARNEHVNAVFTRNGKRFAFVRFIKKVFKTSSFHILEGYGFSLRVDSLTTKEKFLNHSGIGSWFTELIQATNSFENDERIVWISIEGLPIKAWTPNTFQLDAWFPNFQEDDQDDLSSDGESQEGDVANKADNNESDVDRVSESSFMHENDTAHKDANSCKKGEVGSHSEDPFNIYGILDGQKNNVCNSCSDEPKFPPGFTPDNNDHEKNMVENIKDTTEHVQSLSNKLNDRCSNRGFSSQQSMNSHSQKSKVGGSILDLMDELVTVGQTMGYNMAEKVQALKIAIKAWSKEANKRSNDRKINIQQNLSEVDKLIDQGKSNDEILIKRITLLNDLQELNNRNAMDNSQKAKSDDQVPRLEVLFTLLRGQKGCLDCGTNKSPGPYGFFFEFTRKYWTTIDDDVFQAFKKLNGMIFKVDFEKAFDSVKWDYLDETLKAFGFGLKWRNWISSCLNNVMGSVLVNGSPTLEFQFHKGLKQALKLSHKKQIDGMVLAPNAVATAAIVDWPCSILNCSRQLSWMPRGGWSRENYGLTLLEVVELVPKYYQIDGVMAISVISVSSDSSEDSVRTLVRRVILFDLPIIAPNIPPLPAISPFLSLADDTTDSDTPYTPPSPTHVDYSSSDHFSSDDSSSSSSSETSSDSHADGLSDSASSRSSSDHSLPASPSGMRFSHRLCSLVPSVHRSSAISERPSHDSSSAIRSRKRSRSPAAYVLLSSPTLGALSYARADLLP